jgi:glycerol 2-dehydrogenase (NADP+)
MTQPTIKLNNGREIPALGLGTWQSPEADVVEAVRYALKEAGYRHIDCAWAYGNESAVGKGIVQSGVPRSEIFITSKVWGTHHNRVEECVNETLANLGTDYIDLYLIHWPVALNPNGNHRLIPTLPDGTRDVVRDWKLTDTWKQMEELVKKGKVRSIGVSNTSQKNLEIILSEATIVPAVNQLELHIYNPQHSLLAYMRSKGIHAQAYSPLGSTGSPILKDETVAEIADKRGVGAAGVALGYLLKKDIIVLAKSVTPARIKSNFIDTLDAAQKLQKEDVEKLDGLAAAGKQKRFITPPWPVELGFENWP